MALLQQRVLEPPPLDGLVDRDTHVLQRVNVEAGQGRAEAATATRVVATPTRCMKGSARAHTFNRCAKFSSAMFSMLGPHV